MSLPYEDQEAEAKPEAFIRVVIAAFIIATASWLIFCGYWVVRFLLWLMKLLANT